MKITRKDKVAFVTSAARDKIKVSLSKRQQIDALNSLKKAHNGEYAITYVVGDYRYLAYSSARGYSLGAAANEYFGKTGKIVWADRIYDTDNYVFVVIDNGSIVHEIVVEDQDIERYLLASVFDKNDLPIIITSTTLPEFLINFIDSVAELSEVEQQVHSEYILDRLPHNKSYLYKEVAVLEGLLDSSEKNGKAKGFAFVAMALIGFGIFMFVGQEEPQDTEDLVDPFEGYRTIMNVPSASSTLKALYETLKKVEDSQYWVLQKCEMAENMPLICEYKPTYSARAIKLSNLERLIGTNAKASLKAGVAHLMVGIAPEPKPRAFQIVRLEDTGITLYDNLRNYDSFVNFDYMPAVLAPNWLTQNVKFSSETAGLYSLISLANATNGLPINLQSLNINRSEHGYVFQYSLTLFGGK